MLSWLVFSVTLLLLLGHQEDRQPPAGLCFVQSALLYATPPLIAFSMACYLLDIALAVVTLLDTKSLRRRKAWISVILGLFPWFVFLAVLIEVSIFFATASKSFVPSGNPEIHLFCHYNSKPSNMITGTLLTLAAIALFSTKAWMVILLVRKFRSCERPSAIISQMVLSAFIRTCAFVGISLVGIIISELSCTIKDHELGWGLVMPILPIAAALMYGVHADVIHCLMFRRKAEDKSEEEREEKPDFRPQDEETTISQVKHQYESR